VPLPPPTTSTSTPPTAPQTQEEPLPSPRTFASASGTYAQSPEETIDKLIYILKELIPNHYMEGQACGSYTFCNWNAQDFG